jgi:hypothetical protein
MSEGLRKLKPPVLIIALLEQGVKRVVEWEDRSELLP